MSVWDELSQIRAQVMEELDHVHDSQALEKLRVAVLGKKGRMTGLLRSMSSVPPEQRPELGKLINQAAEALEQAIYQHVQMLTAKETGDRLAREALDVTMPGKPVRQGGIHPLSITAARLTDIFVSMGFEVVEGPEIEWDQYNFELLNLPRNHPARDAQDTFYIDENVVLRTHTSPVQARTMLQRQPPIRIICPGRVYRAEDVDATHTPVFHQMEGLVVDEGIAMSDLKGTLDVFARRLYGEGVTTRFRPSFFPFTEPSAEVDLTCVACKGAGGGCRVCKGTGWIEVLGAGMVNPKVLDMCGIDSTRYSGFAFGMGIDRLTNLKYGVTDGRYQFENDLRFLSQFGG